MKKIVFMLVIGLVTAATACTSANQNGGTNTDTTAKKAVSPLSNGASTTGSGNNPTGAASGNTNIGTINQGGNGTRRPNTQH